MALDRFVHWGERIPTRGEIEKVLEDYLGCEIGELHPTAVASIARSGAGLTVRLRGKISFPFRRVDPRGEQLQRTLEFRGTDRIFVVTFSGDSINVQTQDGDEFMNNVAHGFAALCARYWDANLDV